ncbi:phage portal protein [Salinarimonas chemoclinalis]|uniref:phage portal protein n=1 Tax=Salinarimonas chemoclinalis TaxID=3241599 RepID=UPI0035592638
MSLVARLLSLFPVREVPAPAPAAPVIVRRAPGGDGFVRSFEGAAGGRRWDGFTEMHSAPAAILAARPILARRARGLVANSPHGAAGVEAWESALVGTGIKCVSPVAGLGEAFEAWTDDADADGLTDFYGLQKLVSRSVATNGEALVVILPGMRLRVLDPEQLDTAVLVGPGANRVVHGVEFDAAGRRVAYHVRLEPPGSWFARVETVRLPAEDVLHVFRPIVPGQVRGLTWFAAALLRFADYDRATDAQLQRQLVAALLAGFIVSPDGAGEELAGRASVEGGPPSLEPGTMTVLDPGQDVRFSEAAPIGAEAIEFLRITAREIAAAIGVPAHVLTGDLTQANYSSLRAGLVEWRRRVEALQHSMMVFQFCRPVWRRWVTWKALAGDPRFAGFFRDPEAFLAARWMTPRFDWVDPKKDVEAELLEIGAGLKSRRQAVAARGYDVEALDAEIAADREREGRMGLAFVAAPLAAPAAPEGGAE